MIEITINGVKIPHTKTKFSDGAIGVKLTGAVPVKPDRAGIVVKSEGELNDEFAEIRGIVNILRWINSSIRIHLFLPFAPYARQDRRMDRYDAFSLKDYADQLNLLKLDRVVVIDAHSDVAPALFDNCVNIPQDFILKTIKSGSGISEFADVIVAPDAGAAKKALKASMALELDPNSIVYLEKVRDTRTGAITSTKIASDPSAVMGTNCLIIDDLCDGGATFIAAAEALYKNGARSVGLFVTHGIFSRGIESLINAGIDKIWTTNSFISKFSSDFTEPEFKGAVDVISVNRVHNDYFQVYFE